MRPLILASSSPTRLQMLQAADLSVTAVAPRVDEETARAGLEAEGANPQDIADALAEMKAARVAARVAARSPGSLVLGCDQVLDHHGKALGKAADRDEARRQLLLLRGQTHRLLSAAVIYDGGTPVWRHVGVARLTMREFSDGFLDAYLDANWPDVSGSVGCYKIEADGIRLFSAVEGDHFTILGLPLLPLLLWLGVRGFIAT